jgi:hypothetical protein
MRVLACGPVFFLRFIAITGYGAALAQDSLQIAAGADVLERDLMRSHVF